MNEDYKTSPIPSVASIATTAAAIAVSNSKEIESEEMEKAYFTSAPSSPSTLEYEDMMYEYQQFPSLDEFNAIVNDYLQNLSSKKRDKALVDNHRYSLILQVLKDPRNTAISTAQFRFWVKKMFRLSTTDHIELVCHDDKPVATREDIYTILITAHKEAHHGGRDKTSALVRKRYSWIPKELIARFVRHCPFCISRRNGCQSAASLEGMMPKAPSIFTPPPLCHTNFLSPAKRRKANQSMWNSSSYYPTSISMAATVATSAAAAAVASTYIQENEPSLSSSSFDFYYPSSQTPTSPKPSHLFSNNTNNDNSSSYTYFNNNSAAAAAVVAAAAIAAVNSSNFHSPAQQQSQAPPSPSSVSSSEESKPSPTFGSDSFEPTEEKLFSSPTTTTATTNADTLMLPPSIANF